MPRNDAPRAAALLLSGMGVGLPLDAQVSAETRDAVVQPTSAETPAAETATAPANESADGESPQAVAPNVAPIWLQRLSLFVLVLFCVYLGVLVMVLPWWPKVWDQNQFIQARPQLAAVGPPKEALVERVVASARSVPETPPPRLESVGRRRRLVTAPPADSVPIG